MIPRVVHQIWIGSKPPPTAMMATWQKFCQDHGWTYRLWSDEKDPFFDPVQDQIEGMLDYAGKADCMRYLILERHGGIYADADIVLLRPLDAGLLARDFCAYEHELVRPGLLANAVLGFAPGSEVMRDCVGAIATRALGPAFKFSGPYLLTEAVSLNHNRRGTGARVRELRILPSRHFYPVHWTAAPAPGVKLPRNGSPDPAIYTKHVWNGSKVARATPEQLEGSKRTEIIALVERALGIDDDALAQRASSSGARSAPAAPSTASS